MKEVISNHGAFIDPRTMESKENRLGERMFLRMHEPNSRKRQDSSSTTASAAEGKFLQSTDMEFFVYYQ